MAGLEQSMALTGANSPFWAQGSDAAGNVLASLVYLSEKEEGVSVVFAGKDATSWDVFEGGFARKSHAGGQSFIDLGGRVLGEVCDGKFMRLRERRDIVLPEDVPGFEEVSLLRVWPGMAWPETAPSPVIIVELPIRRLVEI